MGRQFLTIALCLGAIVAPADAGARPETASITIRGRCEYGDRFAPLLARGDHAFTLCSAATLDGTQVRFSRNGLGVVMTYSGDLRGDTLAVSSLIVQDGRVRIASGSCEIARDASGGITGIACLGTADGSSFVTNFVASRINR